MNDNRYIQKKPLNQQNKRYNQLIAHIERHIKPYQELYTVRHVDQFMEDDISEYLLTRESYDHLVRYFYKRESIISNLETRFFNDSERQKTLQQSIRKRVEQAVKDITLDEYEKALNQYKLDVE